MSWPWLPVFLGLLGCQCLDSGAPPWRSLTSAVALALSRFTWILQTSSQKHKLDRIWTWLIKSRPLESESVCIDPAAVKASGLLLEYQTTSKACSCARHSKGSQLASTLVFESAPGQHPSWPLCLGERGSPGRRSRLVWLPTASAEPVLATCCLLADRNGPLCQGILSSWRNATGSTG